MGAARVAALFVETDGCYFGQDGVEPWDEARDAREYDGPRPVVAHPPCQRWGRFWHGSPRKPHQFELGDDKGCFMAALIFVHLHGGVIEHPADSHAWKFFGLPIPKRGGGWTAPDRYGGRSCYVEQGHYGHPASKKTWLYAIGIRFEDFELNWTQGEQRLDPVVLARHGYAVARRRGLVSLIGGKDKTKKRNATPPPFRDVLLAMARSVHEAIA
jgi:hypothetical protein